MVNKVEQDRRLDEQDHRLLVVWAADCAERVLPYFETKYPQDDRPRKAIEAGRAWVRGEVTLSQARAAAFAAHAAARDAADAATVADATAVADAAAVAVARSAGHAAATAHVPDHARHAANYAVTAATCAAVPRAGAAARERDWQVRRLPEHLRPVAFPAPEPGNMPCVQKAV